MIEVFLYDREAGESEELIREVLPSVPRVGEFVSFAEEDGRHPSRSAHRIVESVTWVTSTHRVVVALVRPS